jgi:glycerol uptake facilitator-like aquaporin
MSTIANFITCVVMVLVIFYTINNNNSNDSAYWITILVVSIVVLVCVCSTSESGNAARDRVTNAYYSRNGVDSLFSQSSLSSDAGGSVSSLSTLGS